MRLDLRKTRLLAPLMVSGVLLLSGCMDDNYDSSDIDMTMGFGSDSLRLPTNSTAEIPLADVLDLEDDGCVVEEANGDYVFHQKGGDVEPVHPMIDRIHVKDKGSEAKSIYLTSVVSGAKKHGVSRAAAFSMKASGDVHMLDYEGDLPDEVVELDYAMVSSEFGFTIDATALGNNISKFATLDIYLPEYMIISDMKYSGGAKGTLEGNKISIKEIDASKTFGFTATVSKFDFKAANSKYGTLTIDTDKKKIYAKGNVHIEAVVNASDIKLNTNIEDKPITSSKNHNEFEITGASGKFNPSIELNDLGDVHVTGVPDFLTDGNVCVDLNNPQILLTLNSDMDVPAIIDGVLKSYKDGKQIAEVDIKGLNLKGNDETKICVCRKDENVPAGYTAKVVSNLSDIIKTIPDEIKFSAKATADASKTCTFEMGHQYTIVPSYEVKAPIAFAENANIVYKDTLDDLHNDIVDADITDDSDIELLLTGKVVNCIPANLKVDAYAIGVDGKPISDYIKVNVLDDIKASADGVTPVESPLRIEIKQVTKGGINKIDGIVFTASGSAKGTDGTSVTGITLNAKKHNLKINDIKLVIKGKYIADFN